MLSIVFLNRTFGNNVFLCCHFTPSLLGIFQNFFEIGHFVLYFHFFFLQLTRAMIVRLQRRRGLDKEKVKERKRERERERERESESERILHLSFF